MCDEFIKTATCIQLSTPYISCLASSFLVFGMYMYDIYVSYIL